MRDLVVERSETNYTLITLSIISGNLSPQAGEALRLTFALLFCTILADDVLCATCALNWRRRRRGIFPREKGTRRGFARGGCFVPGAAWYGPLMPEFCASHSIRSRFATAAMGK